jgi:type IV secretion system protein VirB3
MDTLSQHPRRITLHRALTRPILLGGAEPNLVQINATCIIALLFGVGIHVLTVLAAAFLAIVGQWLLYTLGKNDPQMSRVYLRHIRYKAFYSARGSRLAKASFVYANRNKG